VKAYAEINHGRWIVECPAGDCYGAVGVSALLMDCDCADDTVCDHPLPCGQRIDVVLPDDAAEITRILNLRPQRKTRNWVRDEDDVASIKLENVKNGMRI
jgi:hypothetical protein